MIKQIIFINSHPIQYFAPLYAEATQKDLPVEAWYWSDESIKGSKDVQFGQHVKWDIPLLEGYRYRFFRNHSWKPSIYKGFFGLINLGLIKAIKKAPPSLFIIHGYDYASNILAILTAKLYHHKVAIRGDSSLALELLKPKVKLFIKKIILGKLLFKIVDYFLYIGQQNRAFYEYYGIYKGRLVFTPYAVDNDRFTKAYLNASTKRVELKDLLRIPSENKVILYSGKYISKKRPMDLLHAFTRLNLKKISLVMVGDGELKVTMEKFIKENNITNAFLTGFINQTDIVNYYAIADVFVMCSGQGETWGLSVNEAMNFHLPVVVSDVTGCSTDLVKNGENGYVFTAGKVEELKNKLQLMLNLPSEQRKKMGDRSADIVSNYNYKAIIEHLKSLVN